MSLMTQFNLKKGRKYVVFMSIGGYTDAEWTGFGFQLASGDSVYPTRATVVRVIDLETQDEVRGF